MAKKRLNIKFLILLGIPVVVLLGGLVTWKVLPKFFPQIGWIWRGTPAQHAAQAKLLFEQGNYRDAGEKYKRAMQVKGSPDAEMYTLLGDCYAHMVLEDPANLGVAYACYGQSLVINPTYMPALERMLLMSEMSAEQSVGSSAASQWDQVQELAKKMLSADPTNRKARSARYRAVIRRAAAGVEGDQQRIDEAVAELLKLSQEPPFDADALFPVLQGKVMRGGERLRQNDRTGANVIFAETMQMLDEAMAQHPDDALLHYRASSILRMLGFAERSPGQPAKYQDRVAAELAKAAELVKPTHPDYVEMKVVHAKQLEGADKQAEAEKVYRALLEERPEDLMVRRMLAELIGRKPGGPPEAIKLLEQAPPPDAKKIYGIEARRFRNQELEAIAALINLRLQVLPTLATRDAQEALLKEIEASYAKLLTEAGESPSTLLLRGQIEMARGQNVAAVQTLDRALSIAAAPQTPLELDRHYRTMFTLARASVLTQQTGRAKALLTQVVKDVDKFVPARLMLVDLLLRERSIDEARTHLEFLEKTMPDSPVVTRLKIALLDKEKDKDKIAELYAKLPETTSEEQAQKLQMAQYLGRKDEAIRLLEQMLAARPNSFEVIATLARVQSEAGQKDKALALIDSAAARYPDSPELKLLRAELSGGNVAEIRHDLVENITDPFEKAMASLQLAVQEDRPEDAYRHLQTAAQLQPENPRVMEMQFQFALSRAQFEQAAQYLETLARKNQDQAGGLAYRVRYALARSEYARAQRDRAQASKELDNAADLAGQMTKKLPEFAASWITLGQVQLAQRKYSDAAQSFSAALSRQPQNLDALRGLIRCGEAQKQWTLVRTYIDQARKIYPSNPVLREIDLQFELDHGDKEKVIAPREELLKNAIDNKSPAEAVHWLNLGQTYIAVARSKTGDAAQRPFYEKARDTLAKAMQKWPEELRFVELYIEAAIPLKQIAAAEKAVNDLRALPAWQNRPEPTLALASLYERAGRAADQEKVLREYLASAPLTVPVQIQLSSVLARQGKLDEALKVLEGNAEVPEIRKQRTDLQITGGRLADAEREIQAALAATSTPSRDLLTRQAYIYMYSGRPTEALKVLDELLKADPGNTEAMLYRGTIYVNARRNIEQAIEDLQIVRDQTGNMDAYVLLSQAHMARGEQEEAIRELEMGLRDRPGEKVMRLMLVRLYTESKPPRFSQAERAIREGREQPNAANDPDLLLAEAQLWLQDKHEDPAKAKALAVQGLKQAPSHQELYQTYLQAMSKAGENRQILSETEAMVQKKQAPWWVYQFRGGARKALDDKQAALEEYSTGLDVASAARDDRSVQVLVETIASDIGVEQAKSRIYSRAEKGENRWRLVMAYLLDKEGDVPGAIVWTEKVIADEASLSPAAVDYARSLAGTLYQKLDPPDTSKAIATYDRLLERNPNDITVLNNRACAMMLPNSGYSPNDALKYSQRAVDLVEQGGAALLDMKPYILDTHGYALILAGRVEEGISCLRQSIDRKAIPETYYHLGEAYLAMKPPMLPDAEDALKKAVELIDQASAKGEPADLALKAKAEKALERARQPAAPGAQ